MDSRYKPSDAMKTALEGLASEVLEMKTNFEVSYTQLVHHILDQVYCRCQKACRPAFMFSRNVCLSIAFICAWYVCYTSCSQQSLCLMMVSFFKQKDCMCASRTITRIAVSGALILQAEEARITCNMM